MAVIPDGIGPLLGFARVHAPVWEGAHGQIGVSEEQAEAFALAYEAAREAALAAEAARSASEAATLRLRTLADDLRAQARVLVRQIKAKAAGEEQPSTVYAAAGIPMDAAPSTLPRPGRPEKMSFKLESSGAVTLSWTARDAASSDGVFYTVRRKLPWETAYVEIGAAPGSTMEQRRMSFTDETVPSRAASWDGGGGGGIGGVRYIVQGRRGSAVGEESAALTVQFGVGGGAAGVAGAMKLAA